MKSNDTPSVSIVMPAYNSECYIQFSIESVLGQTFPDWELIIVDDCSSDHTIEIIKKYKKADKRIRTIILNNNVGAAKARNIGIQAAIGRYMAFLDSDDIWNQNKLSVQIHFMQENQCPFIYSAYRKINETGEVIGDVGVPLRVSYKDMLKTCYIGCLTAIYDTKYFGKVTMPLLKKRQDYALWLKLLKMTECACGINESLAFYRVRKGSISSSKIRAAKYNWILYREVEKLSLPQSLYYFSHYAARSILRYKLPVFSKRIGVLHEVDSK